MVVITPFPIETSPQKAHEEMVLPFVKDIYWSPLVAGYNILSTINHRYMLEGFDVSHYVSYFMEESATDNAPVYILYNAPDGINPEMKEKVKRMYASHRATSMAHPMTYEEMLCAKAYEIAKLMGSAAHLAGDTDTVLWRCAGGSKTSFKRHFQALRRQSMMKVVPKGEEVL